MDLCLFHRKVIRICFLSPAPENSNVAVSTKRRAAFVNPEDHAWGTSLCRIIIVSRTVSDTDVLCQLEPGPGIRLDICPSIGV